MVKLSKEEFLARMAKGKKDAAKNRKNSPWKKGSSRDKRRQELLKSKSKRVTVRVKGGNSIKNNTTKCFKCKKQFKLSPRIKRAIKNTGYWKKFIVHTCPSCAKKFLRPPKK